MNNLEGIEYTNNENTFEYKPPNEDRWADSSSAKPHPQEESVDMIFSDSMKDVKISRDTCIPLRKPKSPSESAGSGSESQNEVNEECSKSSELDEVSAKLLAKIKQMKQKKIQGKPKVKKEYKFTPSERIEISPLQTQKMNLETVNEQEEIFHQRMVGHTRVNSATSLTGVEKDRKYLNDYVQMQKRRELDLLKIFKVIFLLKHSRLKLLN